MSELTRDEESQVLISLIVPVFNLQEYLSECLDSISQQEFRSYEIVAVDGASSDTSRAILDARRHEDSGLTVIYTDRIGPGLARNLGATAAKGEYIWFVDGDDTITPGCLKAIADRIQETQPDVLLIGCEAIYPDGRSEPSYQCDRMRSRLDGCFTLTEQPWVLNLPMTCWNKVIRREFLVSADLQFVPKWPHEDITFSGALLLQAAKIDILGDTCYRYHIGRSGSIMASSPRQGHFLIFNSYEKIFEHADQYVPMTGPIINRDVRHVLFDRAMRHYASILDAHFKQKMIDLDRRRFFARMSQNFRRHVPPGYRHSSGLMGVKLRLIQRNSYITYSLLDLVTKLRGSGRPR